MQRPEAAIVVTSTFEPKFLDGYLANLLRCSAPVREIAASDLWEGTVIEI